LVKLASIGHAQADMHANVFIVRHQKSGHTTAVVTWGLTGQLTPGLMAWMTAWWAASGRAELSTFPNKSLMCLTMPMVVQMFKGLKQSS